MGTRLLKSSGCCNTFKAWGSANCSQGHTNRARRFKIVVVVVCFRTLAEKLPARPSGGCWSRRVSTTWLSVLVLFEPINVRLHDQDPENFPRERSWKFQPHGNLLINQARQCYPISVLSSGASSKLLQIRRLSRRMQPNPLPWKLGATRDFKFEAKGEVWLQA